MPIRAAGCMFVAPGKKVLFVRRTDDPCYWAFPGGHIEEGETACEAACRETLEEIGCVIGEKQCREWTRTCGDNGSGQEVDFTTYIANPSEEFEPVLNEEHSAWCWAPWDSPPAMLHPGCQIALDKLCPEWTELSTAANVAGGRLCSPQKYENITFFLVRVTGTEGAFRHERKNDKGEVTQQEEVVWRDPSLYLNDEFLERCKGLPVILEHPPGETLDTKEYKKRNIGSLMVPHIRDKEVWAVARIMDEGAARVMASKQLSTSPAVLWSDEAANLSGTLDNGTRFIIEGKPDLLDHLAVCWQGVWDKGQEPSGIVIVDNPTVRKDSNQGAEDMNPEELKAFLAEMKASAARSDAAIAAMADVIKPLSTRLDSIDKRFAAEDTKRAETAKAKARKRVDSFEFSSRRDGESDEKYAARHDSEERMLRLDMAEAGESEDVAMDSARKRRKDAEEKEKAERKDDDDDDSKKGRKDSKREDDDDDDDSKRGRKDAAKRKDDDDDDDDDSKRGRKDDDDDDDDSKKGRKDDDDDDDDSKKGRKDSVVSMKDYKKLMAKVDSLTKPLPDAELNRIGALQKRVDGIYLANGEKMPPLVAGDSFDIYQRKILNDLKVYTSFKDAELSVVAVDAAAFAATADRILVEAAEVARKPANLKPGEIRMFSRTDNGHTYNEFAAADTSWMQSFAGAARGFVTKFNTPENRN